MTEGFFQEYRPTRLDRLWSRLGFGDRYLAPPEDSDRWANSYITNVVTTRLDWRDRLRVLISGKVRIRSFIKTDVYVGRSEAESVFGVLPPGT